MVPASDEDNSSRKSEMMATLQSVIEQVKALRMGKRYGQHAPHKPLLLLYALGQLRNNKQLYEYADVDPALTSLLKHFGPHRARHHPEYPFWKLQKDDLWIVTSDKPLETRKSNNDVKKSELLKKRAKGAFLPRVRRVLLSDPQNISDVARTLLDENFPETLHQDILDSVGLTLEASGSPRKRDPEFRRKVLRAYEGRCSVCGYDLRLGEKFAGLEAAHIMWHQVGGPDEESNGLALCVLHHKIFDLGAFTIADDGKTIVCSQDLSGSKGREWVVRYHGRKLRKPQSPRYSPLAEYFSWHRNTIFRGPPRDR